MTDALKLPIPELTETADGPDAFSDLANATEDYLYDRILPTGVTRYPRHHWGTGATYPLPAAGVKAGDSFFHSGLGSLMVYTGTAWAQHQSPAAMTAVQRQAITTSYTADLPPGFLVAETDTDRLVRWNGTVWRLATPDSLFSQGIGNGPNWASTAFVWVSALGAQLSVAGDQIKRRWSARAHSGQISGGNMWVRLRLDLLANATLGLAASSSYSPNSAGWLISPSSGSSWYGQGDLDGRQAATFYLEAAAVVSGQPQIIIPTLQVGLQ